MNVTVTTPPPPAAVVKLEITEIEAALLDDILSLHTDLYYRKHEIESSDIHLSGMSYVDENRKEFADKLRAAIGDAGVEISHAGRWKYASNQ